MDLRQLRNFVQIVELSSITGAAELLNVAQPALSRQVRSMEEELGVALLLRHGRGVVPTEEGIRLARHAAQILGGMEEMIEDVTGTTQAITGSVTIGLPPTVAEVLATNLIEEGMKRFPEVKLRIVSGFSGHVQDWLLRGRIDIGVAYEGHQAAAIRTHPIIIEQLFAIQRASDAEVGDGTPIPCEEAFALPLILPNPEHGLRQRIDALARARGMTIDARMEIDILPTMLAFVERGHGATILPLVSVRDQVRAGRLIARPILGEDIDRTLVLMTPLNRPGSRLTTVMSDFLVDEVHRLVSAGEWPGTTL